MLEQDKDPHSDDRRPNAYRPFPPGRLPGGRPAFAPNRLNVKIKEGVDPEKLFDDLAARYGTVAEKILPDADPGSRMARWYMLKVTPEDLQTVLKELQAHSDVDSAEKVAMRYLS